MMPLEGKVILLMISEQPVNEAVVSIHGALDASYFNDICSNPNDHMSPLDPNELMSLFV